MRRALVLLVTLAAWMTAATRAVDNSRYIQFPDVPGFRTLAVDLHTHSVFSDGMVWPFIRVDESNRDGLALMAVTEHLEYQPRRDDIPHPDRNRSFVLATEHARTQDSDLIVVNGAEITRDMPPGHVNAVFIDDANALVTDDPMDAFQAASRQGAFVFWNHAYWTAQRPDGVAVLTDMHRTLMADGLMQGIEVANGQDYSASAHQIALDHDLTILGVSDIHGLIDWDYPVHDGGHRTVTLVFAEQRTAPSVQAALLARRTVAWYKNTLVGREDALLPLLRSSLTVSTAGVRANSELVEVTLANASDATFELRLVDGHDLYDHSPIVRVLPHDEMTVAVSGEPASSFVLEFEVLNALTAPKAHPRLELHVPVTGR